MASEFIGCVVGTRTQRVWRYVNPRTDDELDDPRLVVAALPKFEPVRMVKIPRRSWETCVRDPIAAHLMVQLVLRLEQEAGS